MKMNEEYLDLFTIDTNGFDLSAGLEEEAAEAVSDASLEALIDHTISRTHSDDAESAPKMHGKVTSKAFRIGLIAAIIIVFTTVTVPAAVYLTKYYIPGKGLVGDNGTGNYLVLPQPASISENGYTADFIYISFDGKYLDVKVRVDYISSDFKNSIHIYPEIFLVDGNGEDCEQIGGATEASLENVTMTRRFVISSLDHCFFRFDKATSDDTGVTWSDPGLFTVKLSDIPMKSADSVADISDLGSYSAKNGISLLALSQYENGIQRINVVYENKNGKQSLCGLGSYYADGDSGIILVSEDGTNYSPINSKTIEGLYDYLEFETGSEVGGKLSIPCITVVHELNQKISINLPDENETSEPMIKTEIDGFCFTIDKIVRHADSPDNKVNVSIYLSTPLGDVNGYTVGDYHLTEAYLELPQGNFYFLGQPLDDRSAIRYDINGAIDVAEAKNDITLVLDRIYLDVKGNWVLDVNKNTE